MTTKIVKLTFREKWFLFWGLGYVVNLNPRSKEIHRLKHKHKCCQTERMSRKRYVSERTAFKLIKEEGYNGCRFCWKDQDKG